jgi:hypothetical protein
VDDVLAVVADLFFQSRISAAARAAGRRVRFLADPAQMGQEYRLALVDLDSPAGTPATIAALAGRPSGQIIAFGPHVDTERRKAARAAGARRVLAKSKFAADLPLLLAPAENVGAADASSVDDSATPTLDRSGE